MPMFAVRLLAHGSECRVCDAARKFFSDHAIAFEEFDIDRKHSALQELVDRTGSATHVPVVIISEETFIDFNEDIATRILELQGQNSAETKAE